MLIDFHTHIFPEKIAGRTIEALIKGIKTVQGEDYENRDGSPLAFRPATLDGLLSSMKKSRVDMSVCLPIATRIAQTESINRFAEGIRNEKTLSFGTLFPTDPDRVRIIEDLAARGFKGIKLHPQFQQTYADSPEMISIVRRCSELGLLVVLHAGADIGLPPPFYATPERIRRLADRTGGENVICAHLGGWRMWDGVEKHLVGTPVMLDTAFVRLFISPEQMTRIIRSHGANKILFGSDSPWEDPADTLRFLLSLGLTDDELELITHKNAEKLLGSAV
ncbi:MAG: amidohydrolase family protein [Clostridia bacterium]|nr:amidohydrolase family protein [Clostridia bacterium]